MIQFIRTISVFLVFNLTILTVFGIASPNIRHLWTDTYTDSVLLKLGDHTHYDFVLMGTSHGATFERGSHKEVETITGKTFANLSRAGGGGLVPELIYLSNFYDQGFSTDTVLYLVDPYIFFGRIWNEERHFATDEPLRLSLLKLMFEYEVTFDAIRNYVQSKYTINWYFPENKNRMRKKKRRVDRIDPNDIKARIDSLYLEGTNQENFEHYTRLFQSLVNLARNNNSRMVFMFPPSLLGEQPGQQQAKEWLESLAAANHDITFVDNSGQLQNMDLYYNLDHLNFNGVRETAKSLFIPVL